jgi:hypothetical protein
MEHTVRDMSGHVIWKVRVAPNELTCTGCGEIALAGGDMKGRLIYYCPLCGTDEVGTLRKDAPALVPTLSYLQPGEYEVMR